MNPPRVLVSAHSNGAGGDPGTRAAVEHAVATGAEYVELDVRPSEDGTLVLGHEAALPGALPFDAALDLVAGRAGVHLDLKLRSRDYAAPEETREVAAVALAVEAVGAERVVVTTGNVRAVRAVRAWAATRELDLRVGLTVGGSVAGHPPLEQVRRRYAELFPAPRFDESGADAVVANHWLALLGVARFARERGLPLLVWTVDQPLLLRHWLRPGRAWMVTTNRPGLALSLRDRRVRSLRDG